MRNTFYSTVIQYLNCYLHAISFSPVFLRCEKKHRGPLPGTGAAAAITQPVLSLKMRAEASPPIIYHVYV